MDFTTFFIDAILGLCCLLLVFLGMLWDAWKHGLHVPYEDDTRDQ